VKGSNSLWKLVDDFIIANKLFDEAKVLTDVEASSIKTATNHELYKIKKRLGWMRSIAIWSFLCGVFSFSLFVAINLYRENSKVDSDELKTPNKMEIKVEKAVITTTDSITISQIKNKEPRLDTVAVRKSQ